MAGDNDSTNGNNHHNADSTRDDAGPLSPKAASLQRRQSTGDRINEILETALQRAESMDPASLTLIRKKSSLQMAAAAAAADEDHDDDDETTGIVSRGSGPSYQSLHMANGGSGGGNNSTRSRRSVYSSTINGRKAETVVSPNEPSSPARRSGLGAAESDGGAATETESAPPRWRQTLAKFQSIELENKGSVARDHLALERTFLAWLRTSLAFASIGVAVTQLFRLNTSIPDASAHGVDRDKLRQMGRPLGATFLAISILTLLLGCKRYFHSQEWILKGKFPASRGTIIIMAFVALALMLLSLVVVIVIQPSGYE